MAIFRDFDAAECAAGGEARFVRRQAAPAMLVLEQREVRREFAREVRFRAMRAQSVDQALNEPAHINLKSAF